jgi:hypothetical protein
MRIVFDLVLYHSPDEEFVKVGNLEICNHLILLTMINDLVLKLAAGLTMK